MASAPLSNALSGEHLDLLEGVLDAIIPPGEGGGLPGAGELGLGQTLSREAPELAPLLVEVLDALQQEMADRSIENFAGLAAHEKRSLIDEIGERQPAFLPAMLFQVYTRYYREPRVLSALGLEGRPPYPLGYELEVGDLGLLDPVRERPSLYRRA